LNKQLGTGWEKPPDSGRKSALVAEFVKAPEWLAKMPHKLKHNKDLFHLIRLAKAPLQRVK
jgi:hypothetical protein